MSDKNIILKEVKETLIDATKEKFIEAKEVTVEKLGDIKEKMKIAEIKAKKIFDDGNEFSEHQKEEMRDPEKNMAEVYRMKENEVSDMYHEV
ncbi:hypothetical protein PVAND_016299 [Polypedilum vanderplanki]|uniref:Uncharacterized protein n=1 Tax=Polypedilum vanderplanki TaxID=319348 RepID=A0A9J6BFT6_POLVA|nr:hypothetical protein PVAND_016299 [Polypedilum vanderplanki]